MKLWCLKGCFTRAVPVILGHCLTSDHVFVGARFLTSYSKLRGEKASAAVRDDKAGQTHVRPTNTLSCECKDQLCNVLGAPSQHNGFGARSFGACTCN